METSEFLAGFPGKLVPIQFPEHPNGRLAESVRVRTKSFVPDPLPPQLDWKTVKLEHFDDYNATIAELGRLNGLHKRVGNAASLHGAPAYEKESSGGPQVSYVLERSRSLTDGEIRVSA